MKPKTDLLGKKFGRLLVIELGETHITPSGQKKTMWKCLCDCGTVKLIRYEGLQYGKTVSCGCYKDENIGNRSRKSGLSKTPEYIAWFDMISRCTNKDSKLFKYYMGRGITVCDRWMEGNDVGFYNFLEDMGKRPSGMSLDRIDPDGNYEPGNCRWATRSVQSFNTRRQKNNTSGRTGVRFLNGKWYARICFNNEDIVLGKFTTFEEACAAREAAELHYFGKTKE